MQKYNSPDLKSYLNTSCASDDHSSLLSSICKDGNLYQSVAKMTELQQIYKQAYLEQEQLAIEKRQLTQKLDSLKERLQGLIVKKFGPQRTNRKIANILSQNFENSHFISDRNFKPGSITKINKTRNNESRARYFDQPTFYVNTEQNMGKQSSNAKNNDKLDLKECKRSGNHKKFMSNLACNYIQDCQNLKSNHKQSKHKYQKSINFEEYEKVSFNIWSKDNLKLDNGGQEPQIIKKSYLNSPRSSALASPRSYLP